MKSAPRKWALLGARNSAGAGSSGLGQCGVLDALHRRHLFTHEAARRNCAESLARKLERGPRALDCLCRQPLIAERLREPAQDAQTKQNVLTSVSVELRQVALEQRSGLAPTMLPEPQASGFEPDGAALQLLLVRLQKKFERRFDERVRLAIFSLTEQRLSDHDVRSIQLIVARRQAASLDLARHAHVALGLFI